MRNTAGVKISPSSMGRREFLRRLGATTVGAAGITGIMGPFDFARAAITPGEKGIYITDMRRGDHKWIEWYRPYYSSRHE